MDIYQKIRYLYEQEKMSQRSIAKSLGISRNTVKRYCEGKQVPWQRQGISGRQKYVVTPEVLDFIKECFDEDEAENIKKQSHTAKRIYDRLVEEEGFSGGESTIREIVAALKEKPSKVFIPLSFEPGEACQIDWGEATAYLAGVKQKLHIFCMRECFSADIFVMVFFRPNEESFLEAQEKGLAYFGGAARRMIFDNAKIAVKEGFGAHAKMQDRYKAFAAHYAFHCDFTNISAGHEKGLVEGLVGWSRRNIFVPVPKVETINELNAELIKRCLAYRSHQIKGRDKTVGELALIARQSMIKLPPYRFDPSKTKTGRVDHFSTVSFDRNHYSVPVSYAGKEVSIKGYGNKVAIFYRGTELARYTRCYKRSQTYYQLKHYLDLIEKRPRSVFNAKPVKATISEKILAAGRRLAGPREMVKLLRLCVDHGQEAVLAAIERLQSHDLSVSQVQAYLIPISTPAALSPHLKIKVDQPNFEAYDALLKKEAVS